MGMLGRAAKCLLASVSIGHPLVVALAQPYQPPRPVLGGRREARGVSPTSVPPHVLAPLQWDLVCSSRGLKQLAQSLYMAGVLVGGIVFGGLSDR